MARKPRSKQILEDLNLDLDDMVEWMKTQGVGALAAAKHFGPRLGVGDQRVLTNAIAYWKAKGAPKKTGQVVDLPRPERAIAQGDLPEDPIEFHRLRMNRLNEDIECCRALGQHTQLASLDKQLAQAHEKLMEAKAAQNVDVDVTGEATHDAIERIRSVISLEG